MAEFNLLQNLHLCTQKSVCATNFGSLGEIGANFSLQLSSRTQFAKINNKKVIAENQCEKHKKSSLAMALIRLHICTGWSEPLLVAHTTLLEISYCGSNATNRKVLMRISTIKVLIFLEYNQLFSRVSLKNYCKGFLGMCLLFCNKSTSPHATETITLHCIYLRVPD